MTDQNIPTDEQAAKQAFEAFYLKDIKGGDGPVSWGHSWVESRWKFWWAAWRAAQQVDVGGSSGN